MWLLPAAVLLSLFILDLIINCLLACGGGIKEEGEGGEIAAHKTLQVCHYLATHNT